MYNGAFDDLYNSSATGSGFMYACGTHTAGASTFNSLWVIAIDTGTMDPTTLGLGPTLTTAVSVCSPITEFNNSVTNNDRIFLSVEDSAITGDAQIRCPAAPGCIMSFDVSSILNAASPTAATASAAGGTSGIVVDNAVSLITTPGASQVYFTPLQDQPCAGSGGVGTGTGGCAIQASQPGLN
jgi:hypothetical protein